MGGVEARRSVTTSTAVVPSAANGAVAISVITSSQETTWGRWCVPHGGRAGVIGASVEGTVVRGVAGLAEVDGARFVRGFLAAGVCVLLGGAVVAAGSVGSGIDESGCVEVWEVVGAWVDAAARPANRPTPATLPATAHRVTVPMRKMPSSRPSGECRPPPCRIGGSAGWSGMVLLLLTRVRPASLSASLTRLAALCKSVARGT